MNIKRQTGRLEVEDVTYTATVHVRHSEKCKDVDKGSDWTKCDCRKSILSYNGETGVQERFSAKTRSWSSAQIKAEAWLDKFDPTVVAQQKADAAKVPVAKAIFRFLTYKKSLNSESTLNSFRCLLGDVDANENVIRQGRLLPFLTAQGVHYVSDITSVHLLDWLSTWEQGDMTAYIEWGKVREFFAFCFVHKLHQENPAINIKRPKYVKGNRTAVFTDKQYLGILNACTEEGLRTFVKLLRWSGMAIVDATVFNIKSLDKKDVLRYKRVKTKKLATIQLPKVVADALRHAASESDQPFLHQGMILNSSIAQWRRGIQELFEKAGIKSVETELGKRNPHPHMFRDTFAVWNLRHGSSVHDLATMLGDKVTTVENHYIPKGEELAAAVLANTGAILDQHFIDAD